MQIVTLQAVKTGGDLMTHLKGKMKDISDRVQKTTIAIVDEEEKIMLARVQFQDALAEPPAQRRDAAHGLQRPRGAEPRQQAVSFC